jgi:predicted nuclease with TOPRIM domain
MKKSLIFLLIISLFSASVTSAQELEKMNKSELREQVVNLIAKIDSLKTENKKYENLFIKLTENLSQLEQRSSQLENKFKSNELEIVKLNKIIADSEVEKKRIISSNQIEISKLIEMFYTQDNVKIVRQLKSIVPEYRSNNSIYESLDNPQTNN